MDIILVHKRAAERSVLSRRGKGNGKTIPARKPACCWQEKAGGERRWRSQHMGDSRQDGRDALTASRNARGESSL
jgi:hypothetical protein